MNIFLIIRPKRVVPEVYRTLKEAQSVLESQYRGYYSADLRFKGPCEDIWTARNHHDRDENGKAIQIPEKIVRISIPGDSGYHLPGDTAAVLELRVITRGGVISMRSAESADIWDAISQGHIIKEFAAQAGPALANRMTEENRDDR